ncbi:MAG: TonB-dependent receptor plug domain-containing protein [Luteitalea sp.]|nr:TonB-dependent receptor plug domain-containing protein [Luteitalea sp.]
MLRILRATMVLIACLAGWSSLAAAQGGTTGTIAGRVLDSQGLAVPGATVTVSGPQGQRVMVTDTQGSFTLPFLAPGTGYAVRVELQGFKPVERGDMTLRLGQTVELTLALEVGGAAETVEVTAASPVVDLTTTTTGATLDSELLQAIPTGRRFSDTLFIAPGVSSGGGTGEANPSFSGGSGLENLYLVDGVNISNTGYGALGSYSIVFGSLGNGLPFDFMEEVQVKTAGYEPEFGESTGGITNVITKSGSNTLRGSAFGYLRPTGLQADFPQVTTSNGTVNTTELEQWDVGVEGRRPGDPKQTLLLWRDRSELRNADVDRAGRSGQLPAAGAGRSGSRPRHSQLCRQGQLAAQRPQPH